MKRESKKGFTLVELSIVLVIIGLLIGGILVGQSLIESAKMQSFVRAMAQYDAATALFKDKYRSLPGDSTAFGCTPNLDTAGNVCGNGVVEAFFNSPNYFFLSESSVFWKHLSDSGFKPNGESYVATVTATTVATGVNVPEAGVGEAGVAVFGTVAAGNFYLIGGYTNDATISSTEGLSTIDALAFDAKTDDGAADAGDVQSVGLVTCNSGAEYLVGSGSTIACNITVRLLSGIDF